MDNFFGRNVNYSKKKAEIYKRLLSDKLSPFHSKNMADVFVYAAVYGFNANKKEELETKIPQISAIAFDNRQKAVLLSIAISSTGGIDTLFSSDETITIIEQYANGGIDLLEDNLLGSIHGDAITRMSSKLRDIIDDRTKSE